MNAPDRCWYDEQAPSNPQTLPQAVCFADTGCSAGASEGHQMFLSEARTPASGGILVFYDDFVGGFGMTSKERDARVYLDRPVDVDAHDGSILGSAEIV